MSETTCYVAFFTLFFLGLYLYLCKKRPKGFPPGPRGIPLFGNAFQLGIANYKSAMDMAKEYGEIVGCHVGSYRFVFLHNAEDVRELFSRNELHGKYCYNGFADENYGGEKFNYGIKMSYGKRWHDLRMFSLKTLKFLGWGKKTMEDVILSEAKELVERFGSTKGQPVSTKEHFNSAAINVMWSIVAGERFEFHDPQLKKILTLLQDLMDNTLRGVKALGFMFPGFVDFRKTFPFLFSASYNGLRDELVEFISKVVKEHRQTIDRENPRDFIDSYLQEQEKTESDPNSSFSSKMDDYNLIIVLMDLFIAGSDTSSYALTWAVYLLALHPEIQEKFHKEIHSTVGTRPVLLQDRDNLPYVEATFNEVLRISSIAPIGSPHAATADISYKGFLIPKHTTVFANIYAIHLDPDNWPNPLQFKPERFISTKGNKISVIKNHKNFIPFGYGRRVCLGEQLARAEIFLVLTHIVQNFQLSLPKLDDGQKYTHDAYPSFMLQPLPHKIIFTERFN